MSQPAWRSAKRWEASARIPLLIMALRVGTLGSRFVLTVYLAKTLGIDELGIFGLVMGLVGIVPPLTGWGLNYFLGREVVGLSLNEAALVVRNRIVITMISLTALVACVPALALFGIALPPTRAGLIVAIVVLETISADLQTPLISLHMTLFSNILMFVRSSPWVFIFVAIGSVEPAYQTLDTLFSLWLSFNLVQFAMLYAMVLRLIDFKELFVAPLQLQHLLRTIKSGLMIYVNDIGEVGMIYMDRYIVGAMLGFHDLGIFTLYWSMASGVNALVSSGVVQPAIPMLIEIHATRDLDVWVSQLIQLLTKALAISVILGGLTVCAAWAATTFFRIGDFATNYVLLLLLLAAATLRALSNALNVGLASRHLDRAYSIGSLMGVLLAVPLNVIGLRLFSLNGVAVAGCATLAIVVTVKAHLLHYDVVRPDAAPAR